MRQAHGVAAAGGPAMRLGAAAQGGHGRDEAACDEALEDAADGGVGGGEAFRPGLSGILCARQVSSLADEPFAEDDGELHLSFEPLARRSFPFLGRVVQDQI